MKKERYNIAAIVVTYNRKDCMINCMNALRSQSYLPTTIYIVDNASTDGTREILENAGYKLEENKYIPQYGTEIYYIRLAQNMGGAGGFYYGIKAAYQTNRYDAFWVMDDDGLPDINCLERMVPYLNSNDYISPLCLAIEDHNFLAFNHKGVPIAKDYIEKFSQNDIIKGDGFPFNGVMYSINFVKKVGLPKKELFIWGDEANYSKRAKKAGFIPITVTKAIHYHPFNRAEYANVTLLGHIKTIIITNSSLRFYCMHRNAAYNAKIDPLMSAIKNLIIRYMIFTKYYLFTEKSISHWIIFNSAFFSGIFNRFNGHKKYLQK